MAETYGIVANLNSNIEQLKKIHNEQLAADELSLIEAKNELDPITYLSFQQKIVIGNKLRQNQITELETYRDQVIYEYDKLIDVLKTKTKSAYADRVRGLKRLWQIENRGISSAQTKYIKIPYVSKSELDTSFMEASSDWEYFYTQPAFTSAGKSWPAYNLYKMPREKYFEQFILNGKEFLIDLKDNSVKRIVYNPVTHIETFEPIKLKSAKGISTFFSPSSPNASAIAIVLSAAFPSVVDYIGNESSYPLFVDFMENQPMPSGALLDLAVKRYVGLGTEEYATNNIELLKEYAEVNIAPTSKWDYSLVLPQSMNQTHAKYFKLTAERLPEPDYGVPKVSRYFDPLQFIKMSYFQRRRDANGLFLPEGIMTRDDLQAVWDDVKKDYADKNGIEVLSLSDDEWNYMLSMNNIPFNTPLVQKYRLEKNLQSYISAGSYTRPNETWGTQAINTWPQTALPHDANDTSKTWYWPRPRDGYIMVPGFDYINPATWTDAHSEKSETNYAINLEMRRRLEQQKKYYQVLGDLKEYMGKVMNFVSKGMSIGIQVQIASLSAMTGGMGAGIAGLGNIALSNTSLGDSAFGRFMVKFGEAVAIANITDAALQKVVTKLIEDEVVKVATVELAEATGLDESAIGRMAASLAVGTAYGMYKDKEFLNALSSAGSKSWRLEAARQNPYAALLIAGATQIEKSGQSGGSSDPLTYFKNFSWSELGSDVADLAKSIEGKDIAKLVAVGLMINSGMISKEDALLMIGQQIAIHNIESFKEDKPIETPMTEQEKNYATMMDQKNRWSKGIAGYQKVRAGGRITKDDVLFITNDVARPIVDRISDAFPEGMQSTALNISMKIGLPGAIGWLPDMKIEPPKWATDATKNAKTIYPPYTKAAVQSDIDKAIKEATNKEHLEELLAAIIIKWIYPRNEPLVQFTNSTMPSFNFIDEFGNINIRQPLRFPYIHPMLTYGSIPRKYTKKELAYMSERDMEMKIAEQKIAEFKAKIAEMS